MSPPGGAAGVTRLRDPQRQLPQLLANQAPRRVLQQLTQIGGGQREKDALRQALAGAGFLGSLPVGGLEGLHGFVGATCNSILISIKPNNSVTTQNVNITVRQAKTI